MTENDHIPNVVWQFPKSKLLSAYIKASYCVLFTIQPKHSWYSNKIRIIQKSHSMLECPLQTIKITGIAFHYENKFISTFFYIFTSRTEWYFSDTETNVDTLANHWLVNMERVTIFHWWQKHLKKQCWLYISL